MLNMKSPKGFTLLELILVVVVIGILATLAVPQFTGMAEKARAAEAINTIGAIKTAEDIYKLETGTYVNDALGDGSILSVRFPIADSENTYWTYAVSGAGDTGYTVTADRSDKDAGTFEDLTIILTWSDTTKESWSGTHPAKPK